MRDLETAAAVLTIAETGHMVFSTGHAPSAYQAMERVIDMFPPEHRYLAQTRLASLIVGVLCQALVPRADGSGRIAAVEVMMGTAAVTNLVREGKIYPTAERDPDQRPGWHGEPGPGAGQSVSQRHHQWRGADQVLSGPRRGGEAHRQGAARPDVVGDVRNRPPAPMTSGDTPRRFQGSIRAAARNQADSSGEALDTRVEGIAGNTRNGCQ